MKRVMLLTVMALVSAQVVLAEDPLVVAPKLYKRLFENDRVRVMEVTFAPGDKIAKHSHPDHFVTVLEPGRLKIFKPDGSGQELDLKKEEVIWIPAESHWAQNTGTTTVKLLVTELKTAG